MLKQRINSTYWDFINKIFSRFYRSKLTDTDFSIICNNCVGGLIYQKFGLPYLTPTVGLFFYSEDYIKFMSNFEEIVHQPLKFVAISKYQQSVVTQKKRSYPIGVIGDNIEIHFMHYKTSEEALEKWNRRKKRLNFNNLFFIYSDRDNFREEYLEYV